MYIESNLAKLLGAESGNEVDALGHQNIAIFEYYSAM